jgi:site-specific recombinase XerD
LEVGVLNGVSDDSTEAKARDESPVQSTTDLKPISPEEAVEWYLEDREDDLSFESHRTQASALGIFTTWTNEVDIDDMTEVRGRQLMRFKTWRKRNADVSVVSLNGNLAILRRFLRFCVQIEAVAEGLPDKVPMPNVPEDAEVCDEKPTDEQVEQMRNYCRAYQPASRAHVEFELVREIGLRMGAIRAIDVEDYDSEGKRIYLHHRPEGEDVRGTPLKNATDGERIVNISEGLQQLLNAYLDNPNRNDVTDKFGRRPLLTTGSGRLTRTTIRRDFYKLSRPCYYSDDCPHDLNETDCEATNNRQASKCESSFSPHPLRRWSIERQLDEGVSKEILSDRVDVSVPVLDKHYDRRTEERKRRRRLDELSQHLDGYGTKN